MGPARHSLRLAARNLAGGSAPATNSSLVALCGFSNISQVKSDCLGYQYAKLETEEDKVSCTSEDESATEEFSLGKHALKLDGIKRKLTFCPKSLIMNDLHWDCDINDSLGTRKSRIKVKLPDDGAVKESRAVASLRMKSAKYEAPTRKSEIAQHITKDQKVCAYGTVKQEPKDESVVSPFDQYTEIDEVATREPWEEAGLRERKAQTIVFPRVRDVKLELEQAKGSNEEPQDTEKQASPQVFSRRKRKMPELVSAGASPKRRQLSQAVEGPALGLEVVNVCPGSAAKLASGSSSVLTVLQGPYPSYARPYPEECEQAKDLLSALHGHLPEYERHQLSCPTLEQHIYVQGSRSVDVVPTGHSKDRRAVLDSLIGTLLSQNTTDNNSGRAFASLKSAFPTWEKVLRSEPKEVEDAIRCGGLAEIKAERIRTILGTLLKERGEISLEYIRSMSNEDIKVELSRFKGVGPKTVACVLMFHLQRKEFPVDTHVFRISKMLGWVPESADREKAYLHLNQRIPDSLKFDIHCLFVTHGKRCPKCAKRVNRQPSDGQCPLLKWRSKWSSKRDVTPPELGLPCP